jgi:membrane-associated phospholipid phosphatase
LANTTLRGVKISVAVSVLALCLLGAISENVAAADPLTRFDASVLESLHRHTTPTGVAVFLFISKLGSPLAMTTLAAAGALVLAYRRNWIVLAGWTVAFTGTTLIDKWLKLTVHRPRPPYAGALIHDPTWSFPSGHAMGALVGFGMLAYVLLILGGATRKTNTAIVMGAALAVVMIGLSRLYLGVHYFSDVVGGYAAGLLWLFACIALLEVARHHGRLGAAVPLNPTD